MIKIEIKEWKKRLKNCRNLETEEEFDEFDKLISMVTGKEGEEVFLALLDAIQPLEDHGVYETLHNAFWKFDPEIFCNSFVNGFPELTKRVPAEYDQIGRFLCPLCGWARKKYLPIFLEVIKSTSPQKRNLIKRWFLENTEWFGDENILESV